MVPTGAGDTVPSDAPVSLKSFTTGIRQSRRPRNHSATSVTSHFAPAAVLGQSGEVSLGAGKSGSTGMTGLDPILATGENYTRFAMYEAAGRSPAYERLAYVVAEDDLVLAFLEGLPLAKRQPNLLFAAARYLLGSPPDVASLRSLVLERRGELAEVIRVRRTQTNEAARCAVLLPALALLAPPLALLEVGASAGLTLLPDVYSYDYNGHRVAGTDPEAPTLTCRPDGPVPLPGQAVEIAWRAGIDLNPLDVDNADDMAWLSCLVWPGEADRAQRLEAAVAAARRQPVTIHKGDLLEDLASVAAQAPRGATLVVYHSAVLAYVPRPKRIAFAAAVRNLGATWLSNEGSGVLPDISRQPGPPSFYLVRGGEEVLARTDPHGTWLEWLA
jgi:hypothetical protein